MAKTETSPASGEAPEDVCYCPNFHATIELIGRRWTGAIMLVLLDEPRQFGAIRAKIPGLSDRLLSERLTELVNADLVARSTSGRESTYCVTSKGEGLRDTFDALMAFTSTWAASIEPACSTPSK